MTRREEAMLRMLQHEGWRKAYSAVIAAYPEHAQSFTDLLCASFYLGRSAAEEERAAITESWERTKV